MQQRALGRITWVSVTIAAAFISLASCSGSTGNEFSGPPASNDSAPSSSDGSDANTSSSVVDSGDVSDADAGKCQSQPAKNATCSRDECFCSAQSACFAAAVATECCTQSVS